MTEPDALARLVLQAAVLKPELAIAAWHEALDRAPLEDWPGTLARPLPRVYLNLRHQPGFTHADRMRGIYRAAWTSNMVMLSRCAGVVHELDAQAIPYRVIKGGAVCALIGSWGARKMGDIDLVVPAQFGVQVEAVLDQLAFSPLFARRRGLVQGPWEDSAGGRLDLHPLPPTSDVARMVFGEPGRRLVTDGVNLHVPTAGASLVLAAGHSVLQVADSDLIQGLLDMVALEPRSDPRDVSRALGTRFQVNAFQSMCDLLSDIGWEPSNSWGPTVRTARMRTSGIRDLPKRAARGRRTLSRWTTTLRNRAVSPMRLRNAQSWLRSHPGYTAWVAFGHVRPIEAEVVRRRGGFLPSPQVALTRGDCVTALFGAAPFLSDRVTAWNVDRFDSRFSVRLDRGTPVRIAVRTDDPDARPRILFINGRHQGWFPVDGNVEAEFDAVPVHGRVEFSFRSADGARTRWLDAISIELR